MLGPLIERLTLSLQVDDRETRAALDWLPPVSPEIGLAATARAFRERTMREPRRVQRRSQFETSEGESPMPADTEDTTADPSQRWPM